MSIGITFRMLVGMKSKSKPPVFFLGVLGCSPSNIALGCLDGPMTGLGGGAVSPSLSLGDELSLWQMGGAVGWV